MRSGDDGRRYGCAVSSEQGPEGRELDRRYRLVPFDGGDASLAAGLVALWTSTGALAAEAARRRVAEAAYVALDDSDGVIGVSTIRLGQNAHLGLPMWSYRTFVSPAHREGDIAFLLLHRTRDLLVERRREGVDTRAAGMLMEVQNEILKRARNEAVWRTTRFTFIGEDEVGAHHRVFFFPGARPPLARSGAPSTPAARRDDEVDAGGGWLSRLGNLPQLGSRRVWLLRAGPDGTPGGPEAAEAAFRELSGEPGPGDGQPLGVVALIADRAESERWAEAQPAGSAFVYAGFTPTGEQVRIGWFEGATIGPGLR
jgi:hypothetical protein